MKNYSTEQFSKLEQIKDNCCLTELSKSELIQTDGGNWLFRALGFLFMTPGVMALNGAAGHEIMGFK